MTTNPWKVTAIAMMLVLATALVTGLVVANWSGSDAERRLAVDAAAPAAKPAAAKPAPARAPTQEAIDACNRFASQVGQRDKTTEVVKDAAVGAVVGAAVGMAGGAIAGGGKGAGNGAAIGGASCMRSRGYPG